MSYIYEDVTEFKLKEKVFSLSGDSFKIQKADSGDTAFQVKGNVMSISDSKKMLDADGNALYKMSSNVFSMHNRMKIEDARTGDVAVNLRKKRIVSLPIFGGRTIQAWKGDSDHGDPWMELHGDLIRKDFTIKDVENDREAAVVSRKLLSMTSIFTDSDVYSVRVNPGYDAALMVFLVIAIDEQYHEDE